MTDGDSRHSQQKLTCSCQHVFQCTQAWNLMHFAKPKYWKISLPPGLYLHAANTQTTRTKCYCAPTSCSEPESDHNLVTADIWLLGRFAPKLRKRETMGRRVTDLQHLMANPQPRGTFIERFTPLPTGTDVDGMATVFTEAMLSTAANIAPRATRCQGPTGWCYSEETKEEMLTAWQERDAAR